MSPGPVSESSAGPTDDTPYVPSWMYDDRPGGLPLTCDCGDHEGFHSDDGVCLRRAKCGCKGLAVSP
jgi:hypothetical protein